MAGQRWPVPPARGLLLCILALQLCLQDPLATAAHSTAANTMGMATKDTSAATKKALAGVVTTKKASLVAVTTKNTSVATQNPAVVAVTKNAMVVATTKNAAVVATASTSVASRNTLATTKNTSVVVKTTKNTTKNTSVVTVATKNTSAATKNAVVVVTTKEASTATKNASTTTKNTSAATKNTLPATKNAMVVVATTKEAPRATKNTSVVVVVTNSATVLAVTNNASLVATNTSMEGAEETRQTCQSFQCSGERCYQDGAHANGTATCQNGTHCELYRFSSTNYTAGCSSGCSAEPCSAKGSRQQQCALECCAGPLCLQLNATAYGDLPPTTTTAVLTTTATSPRPPPQNGKVCAAFSCHGDQCFKGRKTITRCILGQDFCEMKKMGLNYVSGCSRACKAAKPVCAGGMKAACYQECCPATPKGSCLKLDGKVHISSAGQVTLAPLLKVMACGVVLLLNYRVSTSLWG
ncbi:uncharacterized protein [Taeniopygia guttata]|uniref:uncharacterized protein n=1 Tax=Taeniopygia guttata TaxID=59729 RepID=UPI003BB89449